jgi:hypothetical protein
MQNRAVHEMNTPVLDSLVVFGERLKPFDLRDEFRAIWEPEEAAESLHFVVWLITIIWISIGM